MFWRMEAPTQVDVEWLEKHYPDWSVYYGKFWDEARRMTDPAEGALPIQLMPKLPPFCQVCLFPCVYPRPDCSTHRIVKRGGRKMAFCSKTCEWIFDLEPARYSNYQNWYERFDGWNLADVVVELGYVRKDGKTLIAQPTLKTDRMWTVDDLRRVDYVIEDPMAHA
jgi:methane monooxygenase component A alpha chain/propane monooxygenase large subunit